MLAVHRHVQHDAWHDGVCRDDGRCSLLMHIWRISPHASFMVRLARFKFAIEGSNTKNVAYQFILTKIGGNCCRSQADSFVQQLANNNGGNPNPNPNAPPSGTDDPPRFEVIDDGDPRPPGN